MATVDAPQTTDGYIEALKQAYDDLAEDLKNLRSEAVRESDGGRDWTTEFTERRLARVAAELAAVGAEVVGAEGQDGLAAEAVDEAYAIGIVQADAAAEAQGVDVSPADFQSIHAPQSRAIAQELTDTFDDLNTRILRKESDRYRTIQASNRKQ